MVIEPGFETFRRQHEANRPQLVYTTLIADLETPVSVFLKLGEGKDNAFLFESVQGGETRGRYSVIGVEPNLIWRCRDGKAQINRNAHEAPDHFVDDLKEDALVALRALLNECRITMPAGMPPMAAGLFGYVGYDFVRQIENLGAAPPDALGLPDAIILRPALTAIFDNLRDEIILVSPVWPRSSISAQSEYMHACERIRAAIANLKCPIAKALGSPAANAEIQSNTTHADYLQNVKRAKDYVRAGDVFQVVPSQRFRRPFTLPSFDLYRALRRLNPSPFLYHLCFPGFAIVGSSPEILVRLRDGKVTIRPIAGTRPRGNTAGEDAKLAEELRSDSKEHAEHLMLLDLGRNDVGRVSRTGTVHVTDSFFIERYSHVMHLVSNVEGEIREGLDAVDALIAGLPAGTLSGAPKIRAMQIIDELETEKRGAAYAGAVGYFSADGSMDTCIVLRTALLKDGVMYVQAGGGVVAESDPEAEYQETVNKARALFAAAEEAERHAQEESALSSRSCLNGHVVGGGATRRLFPPAD